MDYISGVTAMPVEFQHIRDLSSIDFAHFRNEYKRLLIDVINAGGRMGFHVPVNVRYVDNYLQFLEETISARKNYLFAYVLDDIMLGSAQILPSHFEDALHTGKVVKVMVHPQFRRKGFASTLMHYCDYFAQQHAMRLLYLSTCTDSYTVGFYKTCGYEVAGTIPDYLHDSDGSFLSVTNMYKKVG